MSDYMPRDCHNTFLNISGVEITTDLMLRIIVYNYITHNQIRVDYSLDSRLRFIRVSSQHIAHERT